MRNTIPPVPSPPQVPIMPVKLTEVDVINKLKSFTFRTDKQERLYLQIQKHGRPQWTPVSDKAVSAYLSAWLVDTTKQYFSVQKIRDLLETVCKMVVPADPPLEQYTRIGKSGEVIVLDLHNAAGEAVFITPGHWEVRVNEDVLFRSFPNQLPLPKPESGGSLDEFFDLYKVIDPRQRVLMAAWIVGAFFIDTPRPHLAFYGEPGSGKSNAAFMFKKLIDPCLLANVSNMNFMDLTQALDHNAIPVLDNLGKISAHISDLLCNTYTGGTVTTRVKYTTDEDHYFNLKKGVIMTALSFGEAPVDLLDRMILIERDSRDLDYRSESILEKRYEAMHPGVLGSILDAVAGVMKRLDTFDPSGATRMADYYRIGLLAADQLGYEVTLFQEAFRWNHRMKSQVRGKANPVVNALKKVLQINPSIRVYMRELVEILKSVAEDPRDIPSQANHLSMELRKALPQLELNNITLKGLPNDSNGKPYVIEWKGDSSTCIENEL